MQSGRGDRGVIVEPTKQQKFDSYNKAEIEIPLKQLIDMPMIDSHVIETTLQTFDEYTITTYTDTVTGKVLCEKMTEKKKNPTYASVPTWAIKNHDLFIY